jgi:hypothetical protein
VARSSAGVTSAAVTLQLHAPRPPLPVVGEPVYDAEFDSWSVTVAPVQDFTPVAEVRAGLCPDTAPANLSLQDFPDFFFAQQTGQNCLFVALWDSRFTDWYGPVVMKDFTQPGA